MKKQKADSVVEIAAGNKVEQDEVNHRKGAFVTIRGAELREGHEIVTVVNREGKAVKSVKVKTAVRCGRKSLSMHINDKWCYDMAGLVDVRV